MVKTYRDKPCTRCGALFPAGGSGAKYCGACREKAKREADIRRNENRRRGREKAKKGQLGTCNDPLHTCDTPENVAACLSCTVPPKLCSGECGRVTGREVRRKSAKVEEETRLVAQCLRDGLGRTSIMDKLGLSESQYWDRRGRAEARGLL